MRIFLTEFSTQPRIQSHAKLKTIYKGDGSMSIIKVSAKSRTASVAGAIAGVIREHGKAEVQAIGAGAVNQAIKAVAIADGYLQEEDVYIVCSPKFITIEIDNQERTALRMQVAPKDVI